MAQCWDWSKGFFPTGEVRCRSCSPSSLFTTRLFLPHVRSSAGLGGCRFLFAFPTGFGLGTFFVAIFQNVLDDKRNPAIGGIKRRVWLAQSLIGEAPYLRDLIGANTAGLHDTARSIGAVRGKLPVAVRGRRRVGLGVGVALDGKLVGQLTQFLCKSGEQFLAIGVQLPLPLSKKVPLADSESSMRKPSLVTVISM